MSIKQNIENIRNRIKVAAGKAGRDPDSIRLMAVTKTVPVEMIKEAVAAGLADLGESKVQEAMKKSPCLGPGAGIKWHMIGHLQTNKVRQALELFDEIHSVDSLKLAQEIHKRSQEKDRRTPVYIEVNVSGEGTKYGISPGALPELLSQAGALPGLEVKGLMTMAPYSDDSEKARPHFRTLASLARGNGLKELSMGMSGDFEVAIEEGATIIRVGSALFEGFYY